MLRDLPSIITSKHVAHPQAERSGGGVGQPHLGCLSHGGQPAHSASQNRRTLRSTSPEAQCWCKHFYFLLTLRASPDDGPSRERNHTEGRSACLPCAHAHRCLECPRGDGTTALDHPKNRQNESGRETQFNLSHITASKKRQGWVVCILTLKHTDLSVLCRTC